MTDQQITHSNRAIQKSAWWLAVSLIFCAIAVLAWGGFYAHRRAAALEQLSSADIRPPSYVPAALHSRLPPWAHDVYRLRGTTRDEWKALAVFPEVEEIAFDCPDLNDADLGILKGAWRLRKLDLVNSPRITDAGLAHLERLPRLAIVSLHGMPIGNAGLRSVLRLPQLERLILVPDDNRINPLARTDDKSSLVTAAGLADLRRAKKLRYLFLTIDGDPGESLNLFEDVTSLEQLHLGGAGITNASLKHLRLPPGLDVLDLSLTGVRGTDDLVDRLAEVHGIEHLAILDLSTPGKEALDDPVTRQICERFKMTEISPGTFERSP